MIDKLLCTRSNDDIWSFTELVSFKFFSRVGMESLFQIDWGTEGKRKERDWHKWLAWQKDNPRTHLCSRNTTCGLVLYFVCHSGIPSVNCLSGFCWPSSSVTAASAAAAGAPVDFDTEQCMFVCSFWVWCLRWNFNGVKNEGRKEKIRNRALKHNAPYNFSNFAFTFAALFTGSSLPCSLSQ